MKNFHIANGILSSNSELGEFHYNEADEFPITTPNFLTQSSLSESDEEIVIQGTLNAFAADYYLIEIIDSSKFTPNLPPLSVIDHHPHAGQMVKKNRRIYVTLNPSGYRRISVPNIVQECRNMMDSGLRSTT